MFQTQKPYSYVKKATFCQYLKSLQGSGSRSLLSAQMSGEPFENALYNLIVKEGSFYMGTRSISIWVPEVLLCFFPHIWKDYFGLDIKTSEILFDKNTKLSICTSSVQEIPSNSSGFYLLSNVRIQTDPNADGFFRIISYSSLREIDPETPSILLSESKYTQSKLYHSIYSLISPIRKIYHMHCGSTNPAFLPTGNSLPQLGVELHTSFKSSDDAMGLFLPDDSHLVQIHLSEGTALEALSQLRELKKRSAQDISAIEVILEQLIFQQEQLKRSALA